MNQSKKISIIALVAIMASTFSLFVSYASLTSTLEINNGKAIVTEEVEEKIDVKIANLYKESVSVDGDSFREGLLYSNNKMTFGVSLSQVGSSAEYYFDIRNDGNKDATVAEIKVSGLEKYLDYVTLTMEGLEVGDIINASSQIKNIKVLLTYNNQYYEENIPVGLVLDNVNVEIVVK